MPDQFIVVKVREGLDPDGIAAHLLADQHSHWVEYAYRAEIDGYGRVSQTGPIHPKEAHDS